MDHNLGAEARGSINELPWALPSSSDTGAAQEKPDMDALYSLIVAVVSAIASGVAMMMQGRYTRRATQREATFRKRLEARTRELLEAREQGRGQPADVALERLPLDFATRLSSSGEAAHDRSAEDKALDERLAILSKRLDGIEKRVPAERGVKNSTRITDAVQEASLDGVEKRVRQLEEKQLTEWQVAKVVFAVLAVLGGLVALVLEVIKQAK
jgi:hypothetical protein